MSASASSTSPIGTAKALNFYGNGIARVRVEYVGRAPIEGSDDRMLMATLRDGAPAPAPSRVMVAAAKPFLPDAVDRKQPPLPSERPFTLGAPSARIAAQAPASEVASANRPPARSWQVARGRSAGRVARRAPPAGFAPMRSEGPALGLMSGRGLYLNLAIKPPLVALILAVEAC